MHRGKKDQDRKRGRKSFSAVEIFGGTIAVMILILFLINLTSVIDPSRLVENPLDRESYRLSWPNETDGYLLVLHSDRVTIVETKEDTLADANICSGGNPFVKYARRVYIERKSMLIFVIRLGAVDTARKARDCLYQEYRGAKNVTIGWLAADREVEKVLTPEAYGQLPAYFKSMLKRSLQ